MEKTSKQQLVQFYANGSIETKDKDGEPRIWIRERPCYYCRLYLIPQKRCQRIDEEGNLVLIPMNRDDSCTRFQPRL